MKNFGLSYQRCRDIFISKTALFIWGLLLSQRFAEFAVVTVLMKDLTNLLGGNMRKSAIVVNLQDGLSSILAVVIHILVSYAGHFSVIIFSTACYVTGLMIFWLSAWTSKHVSMFYGAVILIALGRGGKYLAGIFLKYQFKEKLKHEEQSRDEKKERKEINPEQQIGDEKIESGDSNAEEQQIRDQKRGRGDRNPEELQIKDDEIEEINPEEQKNEEDKKESTKIHTDKQTRDEKREGESGDYGRPEINPDPKERQKTRVNVSFNTLSIAASFSAILVNSLLPKKTHYPNNYKVGALLMAAAYLLFYSGSFCYTFGEPRQSPFYKICRVFKAALRKLDLEYPTSYELYYWNNGDGDNKEDFYYKSDRPDFCCIKTSRSVENFRLIPHVPSLWRCLDKAAIKRENPDFTLEMQVQNGQLCTVKEVSEVKHFCSLIHLSVAILPYSLVLAAEKVFFVEQASHMKSDFPVFFLFVFESVIINVVNYLFDSELSIKRYKTERIPGQRLRKKTFRGMCVIKKKFHGKNVTIVRIGAGIVCAVLCCFTAWQVELRRLSLTKKEGDKISMSTALLIPQFLLIGLAQGFAAKGLMIYYSALLPKSMRELLVPLSNVMLGVGKLLTIPFIFIFHGWFKDSINNSHVDRYFLRLAGLNIASFCFYLYYSLRYARKQNFPEDQESMDLDEIA